MGLLTTYSATNFVLEGDYNLRCNQIECGLPSVSVEVDGQGNKQVVIAQWWRAMIEEVASFRYIGMTYSAAQACATAMRSRFTFNQPRWDYGFYVEDNELLFGWHKGTSTPVLESEVRLEKQGNSRMYSVVVNAKCTTENYDKGGRALDLSVRPLQTALSGLPGFTSSTTLHGEHFDAAGADNISILVAPTNTTKFELVAENLLTKSAAEDTLTISNWYKATTDQYAQVKYEGMTRNACLNLYTALNNTSSGWYLSFHPWKYQATMHTQGDVTTWELGWV